MKELAVSLSKELVRFSGEEGWLLGLELENLERYSEWLKVIR